MKCEPVVECNTRGNDGVTITGVMTLLTSQLKLVFLLEVYPYICAFVHHLACCLHSLSFVVLWLGEKSLRSLRVVHGWQLPWASGIWYGDPSWYRPLAEQVLPGPRAGNTEEVCGGYIKTSFAVCCLIRPLSGHRSCAMCAKSPTQNMSTYTLECNRGEQVGIRCKCEEGWKSSGLHRDEPTVYHWCDISVADPANITSSHAPKKLGYAEEIVVCIVSFHYWEGKCYVVDTPFGARERKG